MILKELIKNLTNPAVTGDLTREVKSLTADSRAVVTGSLFIAIRGVEFDGHKFIDAALQNGANAVIAEMAPPANFSQEVTWIHVSDSRIAMSMVADLYYGRPSQHLKIAGVTGTNGKSTVTSLIHHVMCGEWYRAGMLGTIAIHNGETERPAMQTTPGAIELQQLIAEFNNHACRGAVMEVSSHGIHQKRVSHIAFDAAIFTNLSQDHLDYHGTMEKYMAEKASWFHSLAQSSQGKKPIAVINTDDPNGKQLADDLEGEIPLLRYGFNVACDFRATGFKQNRDGMTFELMAKGKNYLVRSPLIGRFNAYNLLATIAGLSACGIKPRRSIALLADHLQVPGRMEKIGSAGGATAFVDYAHTPDALENACRTLKELEPRRLITVFGCGGDRDTAKRPLMAAAAARHSDAVIITSDNPRSEDPELIIDEIEKGLPTGTNFHSIIDREEAIDTAIANSRSGDLILVAGKGHEPYQQFADHRIDFDDRKKVDFSLRKRTEAVLEMRNQTDHERKNR